jgi:hypothetical protein
MRRKILFGWSCLWFLSLTGAHAQETTNTPALNQQLKELRDSFDRQQRELRENFEKQQRELREEFEKKFKEQQAQIEALTKRTNVPPGATDTNAAIAEKVQELDRKVDVVVEAQKQVKPGDFNPAIGLVSETIFSYRSRGSEQTGSDRAGGFDVFQRSVELNLAASVDPFAKAYAVVNASADAQTGEANLGVEEAALQTTSLPWNLELRAGRFFGEFGKLGNIHDHELPFVNRPLALNQYIGGESRTDGAQLSWLPPLSHYLSVVGGVGNGFGGDSPLNNPGTYRSLSGFNYFGRISTYFDLTPNLQLETGISGLINPTTQDRGGQDAFVGPGGVPMTEKERRVAGFDLKVSYVPLANNQFKRFDWGTEVLYSKSRYQFDPDGSLISNGTPSGDEYEGSIGSVGMYTYINYKWHRQWSGGFLFDFVESAANHDDHTFAYSPYITFALSHWNQLRLQYTRTEHNGDTQLKSDDAVYLQWEWIIGAHSHGWQSR